MREEGGDNGCRFSGRVEGWSKLLTGGSNTGCLFFILKWWWAEVGSGLGIMDWVEFWIGWGVVLVIRFGWFV